MTETVENVLNLFKVRKTVLQMLEDRGYIILDEDLNMEYDEFLEKFQPKSLSKESKFSKNYKKIIREALNYFTTHSSDENQSIHIFFPSPLKLGVKHIKDFWRELKKEKSKRCIVVMRTPHKNQMGSSISTQAIRAIEAMSTHEYIIELFKESTLLINVTKHELVPKHIPMSELEKKELFEKYGMKLSQIPRILKSDPISKYYGMQVGQVFKIVRSSETAGRYVTYRLIV